MLVTEIAIVSETSHINDSQLNRVAAALQKQAIRDLEPIWNITATVDAFSNLEDVPLGYWPIIVRDDIGMAGAAGVHLDENGQPFSLVQYSDSWSLTASHEALEMLVDPFGNRLVAGDSPQPGQGRVEFLVEVADPTEDAQFGYAVNGLLVSDFYTPNFFDPVASPSVRYSYGGHIDGPRRVAQGGYLSWHEPVSDHWFQEIWFGSAKPQFRDLGKLTDKTGSLREAIDSRTGTPLRMAESGPKSDEFAAARQLTGAVQASTSSRADSLRRQIEALRSGNAPAARWSNGA